MNLTVLICAAAFGAWIAFDFGSIGQHGGFAWQCGYAQAMHDREHDGPLPSAACRQFQRMAHSR